MLVSVAASAKGRALPANAGTLSPAQAAARLGVTPRTVRNWVRSGKLAALRPSERITRIPIPELERLESRGSAARPDLASVLWDVDPAALDEEASARFIIRRVLEAGRPAQVAWLFRRDPRAHIGDVAQCDRGLPHAVASAWSTLLEDRDDRPA
jgi:excisionase family DNA binding protein